MKADVLASRQCVNDAEYIYSVLKLLHRVGTSSEQGHQCVMRLKGAWMNIQKKFHANKRRHSKPEPSTSAVTQATNDTATIAYTTTAYLLS
jgi:hypothetical protein